MTRSIAMLLSAALLYGCGGEEAEPFDDSLGLIADGTMNPFPSMHIMADGKLNLVAEDVPLGPGLFPVERVNWRTGFSPVQVSTLRIPGMSCQACPKWKKPLPGEGSVLLVDLTEGQFLPVMAELDAHPKATDPTLLIRPLVAVPYGHQVAVVITTDAIAKQDRFLKLISGETDSVMGEHYVDLMDQLEAVGVDRNTVSLAWDYPVGDGTTATRSALAQLAPPAGWDFPLIREADLGDAVPDGYFRTASGSFETTDFLTEDGWLDLDTSTGEVRVTGTDNNMLVVAIPESVKDAPAGSVPILLYGHGLLSTSEFDLFNATNSWGALQIADELGMIVIGSRWRGLDGEDYLLAVAAAGDLSKMPQLTDNMVQGQADYAGLIDLIQQGDLFADDVFLGGQGQPLVDNSKLYYYGVSMGGILGGVMMAQDPGVEAAVFHVGGSSWSTLLERSAAWTQFEMIVDFAVPSPADRQVMYAASQLVWDAVDPAAYAEELKTAPILLQESVNDDTVHNITSRMLARSIDLPLLAPSANEPYGVTRVDADLPPGSRALVQFDNEASPPPNQNRPSPSNGAHGAILGWWEAQQQAVDFLTPGMEGQVIHYCGSSVCARSNRADQP